MSTPDDAPPEYGAWLDKNISYYDPIFRGWRLRETVPLISKRQASFKCWDDRCLYYIYGFPNAQDRDQHLKQHPVSQPKRDTGLPASGGYPSVLITEQPPPQTAKPDHLRPASPAPPLVLAPLPRISSTTSSLPPLTTVTQPGDRRDSLLGYSLAPEFPAQTRSAVEADVDPLLPPLKRSRVGH